MRHRQEHTNPRLQRDKVFALMQILQVVMNTSKLEPIADKNVAAYFHDFHFNSYVKLLYHFKTSISLQIFAFSGFNKTVFEIK